jgi:2-aminoadipate transaminase
MNTIFADRIHGVPRSFIRDILKIAADKNVISFAGGLPNPSLFPIEELTQATQDVFKNEGSIALQYSNSEGSIELRKTIAKRYKEKNGFDISTDQILITNGSQQALDLLGKILLNKNDELILEEPGYLGAIQAFSVFQPKFIPVPVSKEGIDCEILAKTLTDHHPKLMYIVPNFQNPSGICYTTQNREKAAKLLANSRVLLVEDDPYGELRFNGETQPGFKKFLPDQTIMLGTFSKTIVPSFRIGWVVAPMEIMEKLIVAKQAADLHTNFFCQKIIQRYFTSFDHEAHIRKVSKAYGCQRDTMVAAIKKYFPAEVTFTEPDGGMFLWVTLPEGTSSLELLQLTTKNNVVFVPGNQFYTNRTADVNTLRLNYSCTNEEMIDRGIQIMANCMKELKGMKN